MYTHKSFFLRIQSDPCMHAYVHIQARIQYLTFMHTHAHSVCAEAAGFRRRRGSMQYLSVLCARALLREGVPGGICPHICVHVHVHVHVHVYHRVFVYVYISMHVCACIDLFITNTISDADHALNCGRICRCLTYNTDERVLSISTATANTLLIIIWPPNRI